MAELVLASDGELWRICCSCAGANGRPPFAANACCFAANGTGAGGGATFATTGRLSSAAGGVRSVAPSGATPRLARVGATPGVMPTAADVCISCVTGIGADCTGRALVNAVPDVAIIAPGAVRFRYSTLVVVLVLISVTFVTFVTLVTFVTFT